MFILPFVWVRWSRLWLVFSIIFVSVNCFYHFLSRSVEVLYNQWLVSDIVPNMFYQFFVNSQKCNVSTHAMACSLILNSLRHLYSNFRFLLYFLNIFLLPIIFYFWRRNFFHFRHWSERQITRKHTSIEEFHIELTSIHKILSILIEIL